jgi:hypothetical protein
MRSAILIHGLDDARAALRAAQETGRAVTVISGPGGGAYGGPAWFDHVLREAQGEFPQAQVTAILDCDDAAGLALGALRYGIRHVRFDGREDVTIKLREIAAAQGATIITGEIATLDLRGARDPLAACRDWLAAHEDA